MTEEIDVKKLTKDAFMAIDALFTDEDDTFSDEKNKQPDDFDQIQEYMLAIEWECSDKNIRKFSDFLDKITPKYGGKNNQDILKMLTSIVRYLDKSKERALPETHHVMEFIVKSFKSINSDGIDEESIKKERDAAYNKVMDLKGKIAKIKTDPVQTTDIQYHETLPPSQIKNRSLDPPPIIMTILSKLELYENRLDSIESQNMKLQQQIDQLTNLNYQMGAQIDTLNVKLSGQIKEILESMAELPVNSDIELDIDNLSFEDALADNGANEYDEINFDGLDFSEMTLEEQTQESLEAEMDLNEMSLDQVDLDQVDLDGVDLDQVGQKSELHPEQTTRFEIDFEKITPDEIGIQGGDDDSILFEEITLDEIKYEEITPDDLQYEEELISDVDNDGANLMALEEVEDEQIQNATNSQLSVRSEQVVDASGAGYIDNTPQYVRCFKIEGQTIALPEDKIFNIYKIPSKLTKDINRAQSIILGQFSSFSQNLSRNMKGHLKEVSNSILKQMNVAVRLLTTQEAQYKIAVLCSFDDKISIVPVTAIYGEITHPITGLKDGENGFSDYNVNIIDMGTIPFVPLCKK